MTVAGLEEIGVREDITEALHENVDKALEDREKQNGPEVWAQVERFVLLRTIDTLWVEHLTELDDMRRGIGLRGYGGIDPLTEFKREAFKLYEELRDFIRKQVANTIFHVTVQAQPLPAAQPIPFNPAALAAANATSTSAGNVSGTATTSTAGSATDGNGRRPTAAPAAGPAAAAPIIPGMAAPRRQRLQYSAGDQPVADAASPGAAPGDARAKLGRNDPCWCGSGKKFKRCHGA